MDTGEKNDEGDSGAGDIGGRGCSNVGVLSGGGDGGGRGVLAVRDFDGTILNGDCCEGLRTGTETVWHDIGGGVGAVGL